MSCRIHSTVSECRRDNIKSFPKLAEHDEFDLDTLVHVYLSEEFGDGLDGLIKAIHWIRENSPNEFPGLCRRCGHMDWVKPNTRNTLCAFCDNYSLDSLDVLYVRWHSKRPGTHEYALPWVTL